MTEIRLEGAGKRFGRAWALRGVDLAVRSGELACLVGPSGCGKSTLLDLIAGLQRPTEGRVLFDGEPVDRLSPRERDVAMVFQTYALYPHMRVFDNIAFPLRSRGTPRDEIRRRVHETAERLHVSDLLDRKPSALSGGQRQRVALGRALVRRPRLFLFDEPLSNLDAQLRLSMRAEIKRLHADLGATFVYVTHDQTEALSLGQRLALLRAGELLQEGPPLEVYARPADTFVARFLGSPPMSMLSASLAPDEAALVLSAGRVPLPPDLHRAWRETAGDAPLDAGIRAEDVRLSGEPRDGALRAVVTLVEPLGSETLLHLDLEGEELTARADPASAPAQGSEVGVELPAEALHLFDRATGRRICAE